MTDVVIKVPKIPRKEEGKKIPRSFRLKPSTNKKLESMRIKVNMSPTEFIEFLIDNAELRED